MKKEKLFKISTIILVIIALELLGWLAIAVYNKDYNEIRRILLGKVEFVGLQNMISQPYLLYAPSPNLEKYGYRQHNEDGYRGKKVPVVKQKGTYRILFMGGSTTYSMWVNDPDSAYPAITGDILNKDLAEGRISNNKVKKIEVINAGVPWGTSAEILTHYNFKFRYYDPDLVVINTGGNDAYAHFIGGPYSPDFSHFRKSMTDVRPVKKPFRWLFHSRLFSFFIIYIFQDDLVKGGQFVHQGEQQRIRWFQHQNPATNPVKDLKYNAFYNNLNSVIHEIKADSAFILLVPFLGHWENEQYTDTILGMHYFYITLLKQIADENQVYFAPFDPEVITDKAYWMDDCHLNEAGVREKAHHIARYISNIINANTLSSGKIE